MSEWGRVRRRGCTLARLRWGQISRQRRIVYVLLLLSLISCGTWIATRSTSTAPLPLASVETQVQTAITMTLWVNLEAAGERQVLLQGRTDGETRFILYAWNDARLALVLHDGERRVGFLSDDTLEPDRWVHIAVMYDAAANVIRYYLDGRLAGEDTIKMNTYFENIDLIAGACLDEEWRINHPLHGEVRQPQLHYEALSRSEIKSLMRKGVD